MENIVDTKPAAGKGSRRSWSNWSGSAQCTPAQMVSPRDEDELKAIVQASTGQVRVCGAGHSFTPVAATDHTMVTLRQMPGDVLSCKGGQTEPVATLQAGASLNRLSRALQERELALRNLGDIDVQSLAGAAMTGTHGTGRQFPCLAGEIVGVRLMTANADIVTADLETNPDLLRAAQVSLGTLGIVLEADVRVRPAFKLRRRVTLEPLKSVLADAHSLWQTHRNFEMFVLPFCDHAVKLVHDETTAENMHDNPGDDDALLRLLRVLRTATGRLPWVRRKIMNGVARTVKPEVKIDWSWKVLASQRGMTFHEMEYHLPADRGLDVLAQVLSIIERDRREVFFPLECRMTAADDGWLSPFHDGPRISIAVHAHQRDDYKWFYEKLEPVFRHNGGRPHWGKLHSLTQVDHHDLYPKFPDFLKLRKQMDPQGRFLNDHLAAMFGA